MHAAELHARGFERSVISGLAAGETSYDIWTEGRASHLAACPDATHVSGATQFHVLSTEEVILLLHRPVCPEERGLELVRIAPRGVG